MSTARSPGQPMTAMTGPRVALVTPSLNQARYLSDAIESVLAQSYPNIDYLVVDGGSEDESLGVLRSYGDRVRWISEPDAGQSDAIDKGFRKTRGQILGWLNADDVLAEDAVAKAVAVFEARENVGLVYGNGFLLDEQGRITGPFEEIEPFNLWRLVNGLDYILQPAAFFRRRAYDQVGGLDIDLSWAMDWDLWIRLAASADVEYLPDALAGSRIWDRTKTSTGGWKRLRELRGVARRHADTSWTPGVKLYALETLRAEADRSLAKVLSRMVDALIHRGALHIVTRMASYPDGWLGPAGQLLIPRRYEAVRLKLETVEMHKTCGRRLEVLVDGDSGWIATSDRAGLHEMVLRIPQSVDTPFCPLEVNCGCSFTTLEDPRRLSVRVLELVEDRE